MEEKNTDQNKCHIIKKGKFLWKDEVSKKQYLHSLKKKIEDGFFYSERVISQVVEEIAPVLNDILKIEN